MVVLFSCGIATSERMRSRHFYQPASSGGFGAGAGSTGTFAGVPTSMGITAIGTVAANIAAVGKDPERY